MPKFFAFSPPFVLDCYGADFGGLKTASMPCSNLTTLIGKNTGGVFLNLVKLYQQKQGSYEVFFTERNYFAGIDNNAVGQEWHWRNRAGGGSVCNYGIVFLRQIR
jgi:hypothetical protein